MTDTSLAPASLVNGIYPLDYFTLSGVKQVAQPNAFWWSSAERYAAIDAFGNYQSAANGGTATSETLEIDLGRIREVNYINFDILRAPIDIAIEFDALSTPDRTPIWKPTQQKGELPYEDATNFSPDNRNAWHNVEFNLTDQNGNMVHTRYLRLTFERRDEAWPTSSALPFPWAIFVQNLRVGRYVSEVLDTVGPLLSQDTPSTLNEVMLPIFGQDSTHEARQRFIVPIAQVRVGKTPNLLGFGVLVKPSNITQTPDLSGVINMPQTGSGQATLDTEILLGWSLYDVTDTTAFVVGTPFADAILNLEPSLYWRLGEASGTTATDSSGNGNDGTYGSGVTLGEPGALTGEGDPATSALFNNTGNAKVTSPYSPFVVGSQRTFMGWANRAATDDNDAIFGDANSKVGLFIGVGESVFLRVDGSTQVDWTVAWPGLSQWVHWAVTYDDSTKNAELFINGVSKGVLTESAPYTGSPTTFVAGTALGAPFNGLLQDVAVFEKILTADQIAAVYQASQPSGFFVEQRKQPSLLVAGTMGPVEVTEEGWVDVYLDDNQIIPGDTSKVYEFRVSSLNQLSCNTVLTTTPNLLSTTPLDGTLTFTSGLATVATTKDLTSVLKSGDYFIRTDIPDQPLLVSAVASNQITLSTAYVGGSGSSSGSIIYPFYSWDGATYVQDASQNLVMRVWSDIADDGQDVLGNAYRNVVRQSPPENVIIGKDFAGWMSDPFPTPEAVEALYFDVRHTDPDTSRLTLTLIEALQIAPRTPGVKMNVYWTAENVHGDRPVLTEEWDNLYWTPVTQTYTLRRNEIITLPQPFAASFVKLEFSGLQPLPYNLPDYPRLPPVQFRTFPTWVNATFQSAKAQQTIQDWFLRNATPVQQQVLKSFSDPVREFQYQQQTFLAQLALGTLTDQQTINSGLVDLADKALVDPTTASKIYVSTSDQYGSSLTVSVDQSSVLGKVVAANYDLNRLTTPTENQNPRSSLGTTVPIVSTINDRISQSFQSLAQTPMRFYKPSRHIYTTEQAEFNKKAYFVGIDKIRFLRIDYTSLFDDALIQDILYDDVMLESNTWTREAGTAIPEDPIVYVSYEVGDTSIVDEPVELSGANAVQLATTGAPARNIFVFAGPNYTGVQYFQNYDYEIGYGRDSFGNLVTYMERSLYGLRMVVPLQPLIYNDAFTVIAQAIIPSEPFQDTAVVTATAVISGFDGQDFPTYGSGTYGGTATTGEYGDLRKETDDAATVVGTAVISGSDTFVP